MWSLADGVKMKVRGWERGCEDFREGETALGWKGLRCEAHGTFWYGISQNVMIQGGKGRGAVGQQTEGELQKGVEGSWGRRDSRV